MSEHKQHRPEDDPVNYEAEDWAAAGLPEQEDATEDEPLPGQEAIPLGEEGVGGTEREAGESHDVAFARERPDITDDPDDLGTVGSPAVGPGEGLDPEAPQPSDTSETGVLGSGASTGLVEQDEDPGPRPRGQDPVPSSTARLVEQDEGVRSDTEKDLVARAADQDEDASFAEDAAVRIVSEDEAES